MNISATELPNFIRKYYLLHELLITVCWCVSETTCDDDPCQNRGHCVPQANYSYSCVCWPGFTGRNCESSGWFTSPVLPTVYSAYLRWWPGI